ncbi:MAG: glycerol-3-phosphate dehydrogenase [Chloroflexia bacterium]|jgi:glycerol-3-phosphate dehydrogenase (NAD(P)+)|nr:glycerol-3-phosphate dehydrogenase [Chloroflexia bacterium]
MSDAQSAGEGRVAVVGTGSWGTTLAILASRQGRTTYLLARTPEEASRLRTDAENRRFLPGYPFPPGLIVTSELEEALRDCDMLLMVVPSQTMRANTLALKPYLHPERTIIVSCAKGLELGTMLRMSEVIVQELGDEWAERVGALSGPNLAKEIVAGRPATTVIASTSLDTARQAQELLTGGRFRVYTNPDLVGVELAGALKNIIAVAAGMADGMEAGDSSKAALITRGLVEIGRLGLAAGASLFTFAGLAGLGDMIATCASPLSRNRTLGEMLARGKTLEQVKLEFGGQVAEGVTTTVAAREMAAARGVEMPITEQLYQVLFEGKPPMSGLNALLTREPTDEFLSLGVSGQEA